jgi:uncharacterized protein
VAYFFGLLFVGLAAIGILTFLGLLLDFIVSRNYQNYRSGGGPPSWWAGGTHFGGTSGSGGFGGFSGGSFGGGGASGDW